MARIIAYPQVTPAADDYLVGTQKSTGASTSNLTKNFTVADVVAAGSSVKEVTVSLTNAEWLGLPTGLFTLIAAPGANKAIKVTELSVFFDFGTTNFTLSGGLSPNIEFDVGSTTIAKFNALDFPMTTDTIWSLPPYGPLPSNLKLTPNTAFALKTAGTTGGDGTVKIKISYIILDITDF